ncbi:uncharacterized protein LOC127006397 [Eriocheir sinensis]|uniref:uncharacterized protein LOC127006397 n=1 Tax=Eriocheir sinensis TaxID=95602 RepID=UPI0021C84E6A|nr:uncharacterized protein LOC127006397 [Eriocheir sinensis]XP_050732305.1 uncharacterized protein LOC127006397 [Eriocheir sinensis]
MEAPYPGSEVSTTGSGHGRVSRGDSRASHVTSSSSTCERDRWWGVRGCTTVLSLHQVVTQGAYSYLAAPPSGPRLAAHLHLSHTHLSVLLLLTRIGPLLTGVLAGVVGGRGGRRGRWVASGQAAAAAAAILAAATALAPPPPPPPGPDPQYCDVTRLMILATANPDTVSLATLDPAREAPCPSPNPFILLTWVIAALISGVGCSLAYILGLPYLDDGVRKEDAPLYLAVILSSGAFGQLIGESLAGLPMGSSRVAVVWWVGLAAWGAAFLVLACLTFMMPRHLKGKEPPDSLSLGTVKTTSTRTSTPGRLHQGGEVDLDTPPPSPPPPLPPSRDHEEEEEEEEEEERMEERDVEGGYEADVERDSGYSMEESEERVEGIEEEEEEDKKRKKKRKRKEEEEERESKVVRAIIKKRHYTCYHLGRLITEAAGVAARLAGVGVVGAAGGLDLLLGAGAGALSTWGPIHVQNLYRTPGEASTYYTGMRASCSMIVGVGVGWAWVSRCRPHPRTLAACLCVCLSLLTVAAACMAMLTCDFSADLPGVPSPDHRRLELHRGCSERCRCPAGLALRPVCIRDGPMRLSYFSPCHAGCPPPPPGRAAPLGNCTCGSSEAQVSAGYCHHTCPAHVAYTCLACLASALLPVVTLINLLLALRSVRGEDKPAVLGLKVSLYSLGFLLGATLVGGMVAPLCLAGGGCGGATGGAECSLYDAVPFAHRLHGTISAIFTVATMVALYLAHHASSTTSPINLYDDPHPHHDLTSVTSHTGVLERSGLRRSLRKLSRLAAGKTSTGHWNVPRVDILGAPGKFEGGGGGERNGGGGVIVVEGNGGNGGEEGTVVAIRRLPSVTLMKTTGV